MACAQFVFQVSTVVACAQFSLKVVQKGSVLEVSTVLICAQFFVIL